MMTAIFTALAMCTAMPVDNYASWFSPEIAELTMSCAARSEYYEYLDFNGDGELSCVDAIAILRRYNENCEYGNELTVDSATVADIVYENYSSDCIYYEFDFINGEPCREYEVTVNENSTANLYLEFADGTTDNLTIFINPFEEIISVE